MRPFKPIFILEVIPVLLPYLSVTIFIMIGTVFLGGIFGFILAKAKVQKRKIPKLLADAYIGILRCTPSIVLLFIIFYGLPELLEAAFGWNINDYHKGIFVIITFTLIFAATMAEVMRTAYESIDKGQYEAAVSVGLTELQAFYRILLPQCIVVALPNFSNSLIGLMKEGTLAYTIGLIDIMGKGQLVIGNHYGSYALETYIALAIVYWGMTIIIEKFFARIERKLSKGKKNHEINERNIRNNRLLKRVKKVA